MTKWTAGALLVSVLVAVTYADVYLQYPPGSNNRLNGNKRNRRNANRLFDSQNNARGGYNQQSITHYAGSNMYIEWTNQHQCGGQNTRCDIIVQYMCDSKMRDGTRTNRIPIRSSADTSNKYGMNEDYMNYETCLRTQRNKRLYLAAQELVGDSARYTRQNSNGNRHGFECPEERDYYPYWRPTPWKDIVIMTDEKDNTKRCANYKANSQNQNPKYHCVADYSEVPKNKQRGIVKFLRKNLLPVTEKDCKAYSKKYKNKYTITGKWEQVDAHDVPEPDCIVAPYSRDNHLGNGIGGFPNSYNWSIPANIEADECVLRIRYNISTGEFPRGTDSSNNNQALNLGSIVNLDEDEAEERGYTLTGNPDVYTLKKSNGSPNKKFELKLAVNTNQYGRTFEDRTHVFAIKKRPNNVPADAKIHTISVRGKRGNIVQTYPATEYDFAPNRMEIEAGDYVNIAWSGSNKNPKKNAGQGTAGQDRHNIILLTDANYEYAQERTADKPNKYGHWANSYPKRVAGNGASTFLGLSTNDAKKLADALDQREFALGLRKVDEVGMFRFYSTRNNAFTNRGQKACVKVNPASKKDTSSMSDQDRINAELQDVEASLQEVINEMQA